MPLFSQIQGKPENPTLVFLHGFLGNTDDWSETVDLLKEDYCCVCLDLPGHGHSVATTAPLQAGFAYCHRLIREALDDLQIKQYTLIGYSLGGRIALDYARSQNDPYLQHLVLESCHTGLSTLADREQRHTHDLNWAKRFATGSVIESLYEWYEQAVFSDLSCQEKDQLINKRRHNYGVCLANMLLATSLSKQTDILPFLENDSLKVNPLTIYYCFGEKDLKFKELADKLSRQTNIKVTEFAGAGHNIHHQSPLKYAQFIMQQITK